MNIIDKIAGDTLREHIAVPMMGTLRAPTKDNKYVILEVPEDFCNSIYEAIYEEGMQKPPDFKPHISVMTDDEFKKIKNIEEDGKEFKFTIHDIESCNPDGWPEMEKVYFVRCKSKELENLRKKYDLTPLVHGDHDFHISIAVVPKDKKTAKLNKICQKYASVIAKVESIQLGDMIVKDDENLGISIWDADEGEQNCWFNLEGTKELKNWLEEKLGQEIKNIQASAKRLLDNYESKSINHILYSALEQFQKA